MLNEILQREDVKNIIDNIKNNEKYYEKISTDSDMYYKDDISLYLFYEALFKYYIIFDDYKYLGEYVYDVDLLYRKIETIEDMRFGISQLIVKFTMKYLGFEPESYEENRKEILGYVFGKYITNGYLIHGFSSTYSDKIISNGFNKNNYFNYYDEFIKLNDIFKKYNKDNFIDKNFLNREIFFSDDFVKTCLYSINSPMYYCNLLTNNEVIKDKQVNYYKDNYDKCLKSFNKVMDILEFNREDRTFALDLVNKEWDLLHKKDKRIALLLVKRELFDLEEIKLEDIINSDLDINEAVDRILTDRYKDISYDKDIDYNDLKVLLLDIIDRDKVIVSEKEIEEKVKKEVKKDIEMKEFNDTYGMISPLLLIGSLLISAGVIMSIIRVLGG